MEKNCSNRFLCAQRDLKFKIAIILNNRNYFIIVIKEEKTFLITKFEKKNEF